MEREWARRNLGGGGGWAGEEKSSTYNCVAHLCCNSIGHSLVVGRTLQHRAEHVEGDVVRRCFHMLHNGSNVLLVQHRYM